MLPLYDRQTVAEQPHYANPIRESGMSIGTSETLVPAGVNKIFCELNIHPSWIYHILPEFFHYI